MWKYSPMMRMNNKEMYTVIYALQKSCGILFTGRLCDLKYFCYQQSNGVRAMLIF